MQAETTCPGIKCTLFLPLRKILCETMQGVFKKEHSGAIKTVNINKVSFLTRVPFPHSHTMSVRKQTLGVGNQRTVPSVLI